MLLKDLSSFKLPNLDARIVIVHAIVNKTVTVMVGKESAKSHVSVFTISSNDVPKTIIPDIIKKISGIDCIPLKKLYICLISNKRIKYRKLLRPKSNAAYIFGRVIKYKEHVLATASIRLDTFLFTIIIFIVQALVFERSYRVSTHVKNMVESVLTR